MHSFRKFTTCLALALSLFAFPSYSSELTATAAIDRYAAMTDVVPGMANAFVNQLGSDPTHKILKDENELLKKWAIEYPELLSAQDKRSFLKINFLEKTSTRSSNHSKTDRTLQEAPEIRSLITTKNRLGSSQSWLKWISRSIPDPSILKKIASGESPLSAHITPEMTIDFDPKKIGANLNKGESIANAFSQIIATEKQIQKTLFSQWDLGAGDIGPFSELSDMPFLEQVKKRYHKVNPNFQPIVTSLKPSITLLEVPPSFALFRGLIGKDCSTELSAMVPWIPTERVYFVQNTNGALKGYVSGTIVEDTEKGKKALMIHTINGDISAEMVSRILMGLQRSSADLGVDGIAVTSYGPFQKNVRNFEILNVIGTYQSGQSFTPRYSAEDTKVRHSFNSSYDLPADQGHWIRTEPMNDALVLKSERLSKASFNLPNPSIASILGVSMFTKAPHPVLLALQKISASDVSGWLEEFEKVYNQNPIKGLTHQEALEANPVHFIQYLIPLKDLFDGSWDTLSQKMIQGLSQMYKTGLGAEALPYIQNLVCANPRAAADPKIRGLLIHEKYRGSPPSDEQLTCLRKIATEEIRRGKIEFVEYFKQGPKPSTIEIDFLYDALLKSKNVDAIYLLLNQPNFGFWNDPQKIQLLFELFQVDEKSLTDKSALKIISFLSSSIGHLSHLSGALTSEEKTRAGKAVQNWFTLGIGFGPVYQTKMTRILARGQSIFSHVPGFVEWTQDMIPIASKRNNQTELIQTLKSYPCAAALTK